MFTKEELDYIDRNLEINYREDHVDKDESSYYSIKVKLATLINKPVETTNQQPKKDFPCKGMYKYPGACGLEQECTCS